ncbi:MAG: preprotein translocase subunit SecG [Clostridia bacterium]|nr:preprotein translocase subunit SecG [Clostridia bacterium]
MESLLNSLLAITVSYNLYHGLLLSALILSFVSAVFLIIVVMIQPGNSSGLDALNGSSDTFYGKNKSKTIESKLKKLTVICVAIVVVLMVLFYLIQVLLQVG